MDKSTCPRCGGSIVSSGNGRFHCPYCRFILPEEITNEELTLLYNANQQLRVGNFDGAESLFRDILSSYPKSYEAHWGLVLARYGIKYEKDYDGTLVPSCYSIQYESIFEDPDYQRALALADERTASTYRSTAQTIENVRKEWLEKASREAPYDIFLSYKDTEVGDPTSKTEDYNRVYELYNHLTGLGYRVFFARVSLRNKAGEKNFEPYIFNAINTARVMIVYASKPEYVTATWVKNEWSRFYRRMKDGRKQPNSLVVAYNGFNPALLPKPLDRIQNFDAGSLTFVSDLDAYLKIALAKRPAKSGKKPAKKTKRAIVATVLSALALGLSAAIAVTFVNIWSVTTKDRAIELTKSGDFEQALTLLGGMDSNIHPEVEKLICSVKAVKSLSEDDYKTAVELIDSVGGTVNIKYDCDGGTLIETGKGLKPKATKVAESAEKTGYVFSKWKLSSYSYDLTIDSIQADLILDAQYSAISYSITYLLDGGKFRLTNPSYYTIETETITLNPPSKEGYTFAGWKDSNGNAVTSIAKGTTGNITLTATWTANLNQLSVTSEDESKGSVSVLSGQGYSGETITVLATAKEGYEFIGWYDGSKQVASDLTYSFPMPGKDYALVAKFQTNAEEAHRVAAYATKPTLSSDGKKVTYGLYPQKNVNDASLVAALDSLTAPESNGYYLYEDVYYAKTTAQPYESNYVFDNGDTVVGGTNYWFECEPITWNVLSIENGECLALSDVVLDAHRYNECYEGTQDGIYANNYANSEVRSWLNGGFCDAAFNLGDSAILTTEVDNDASTASYGDPNPYACENTYDKVFLLSCQDYVNIAYGFDNDVSRQSKTTDWARAKGAIYSTIYQYNATYWLRSPHPGFSYCAWLTSFDGTIYSGSSVDLAYYGVRPAITIALN